MEPTCKTCRIAPTEDGEVRCRECHKAFRRWLDGVNAYSPTWDGLVVGPSHQDKPVSRLDKVLARKKRNEDDV